MSPPATWDGCVRGWWLYAQQPTHKRRVAQAIAIARDGAAKMAASNEGHGPNRGKGFGAISGGKDSVALAGIMAEAGLEVTYCHASTELNVPGMDTASEETAERLGLTLEVIEPDVDVWELLRTCDLKRGEHDRSDFYSAIAAGNMLVQYAYEGGFAGSYSGMRADESRGRKMNFRNRGPTYQYTTDRQWMCSPLAWWSATDVFAFLVSRELPIHPYYKMWTDRFREAPDHARVDLVITRENVSRNGAMAVVRLFYPDLWRRIVAARPELARET